MSNRHVTELLSVYRALVRDALCSFPQLERSLTRDLERLRRVSLIRGIQLFTVDLPAIGKHLDRCLDEGLYSVSGLPISGRSSQRDPFPAYLGGLLRLVFEDSGSLREESCDVEAVVFLRQFLYCAKKTVLPCSDESTSKEVEDFVQADASLPIPSKVWAQEEVTALEMQATYGGYSTAGILSKALIAGGISIPQARLFALNLDTVSGFIASTLGSYDPKEWNFRHGPGAIAEKTGPVNKYHWSNWSSRLEARYPIADCGFHNYCSWMDRGQKSVISELEPHSRLVAVPKTFLKPRLIAAEPSENQWCQQNLWHYFSKRCAVSWIHNFVRFRDQVAINQVLCKKGSQDGSLVTADLSAASDTVTCDVVGQLFRGNPELLCYLQAVRTRFLEQSYSKTVPQRIELRKFSTMGSACTFPVESLVFLSVALACSLTTKGLKASAKNILELEGTVAVFGDDIIVPKDSWELMQKALSELHFVVNKSKSYATGRFRESCGVDSFRGVDVTPVYWKGICTGGPESIDSSLATSNNFHRKFFINAASEIRSTIPRYFAGVAMGSGVMGTMSFLGPRLSDLTIRWNRDLQRPEALTSILSGTQSKLPPSDDSGVFQYFTEHPDPQTMWTAGTNQRPRLKIRRGWVPLEFMGLTAYV